MTLEDALGRKPSDLEDCILARAMFPLVKHGCDGDPQEEAIERINSMSNWDLIQAITMGLSDLAELSSTSSR